MRTRLPLREGSVTKNVLEGEFPGKGGRFSNSWGVVYPVKERLDCS